MGRTRLELASPAVVDFRHSEIRDYRDRCSGSSSVVHKTRKNLTDIEGWRRVSFDDFAC